MTRTLALLLLLCLALGAPLTARADLPSFLRMRNSATEDGNELLAKGDAKGALAAYDKAARELPNAHGVQLNRGLALLKLGELGKAREALLSATAATASPEIRADAYTDLALGFYREADALAGQKKHEEAQKQFAESVDAAKHALRLRPGDPNAAWNLELAARRMLEEQKKHKEEQDKQKQDKKDEEQKKQDGEQKPSDGDPSQDPDKQDQNQDQQGKDPQAKNQEQKPGDKPEDKPKPPESPKDEPGSDAQKQEQAKKDAQKAQEAEKQAKNAADKPLPSDVAHALDALQDGEENFERMRARQRAQQERRAPEKDW